MKDYEIEITEALKRTVKVEAESREEAEELVSDKWHNGEYILDADDFTEVSFHAKQEEREIPLAYRAMCRCFTAAEKNNIHVKGYIVFDKDSFDKEYDERSRTYIVSSDNKAFKQDMGGYSIYGSCLDGTDGCVRLENYMAAERGGKNGWSVERCYMMKEDYDKVKGLTAREKDMER